MSQCVQRNVIFNAEDDYGYILDLIITHCMHALKTHSAAHKDIHQLYVHWKS